MEQLEKYFDTAFGAPDGVSSLRKLILTFALQGKLVPQIKGEKSAIALLSAIAKNNQIHQRQGSEKKPKTNLLDNPAKWIYELPHGWALGTLNNIGNIFNGNSINATEKDRKYRGVNGLPYIATKDVGYGFQKLDYENGIKIPFSEKNFKIAHSGSVLLCAEGGSAGKKCGIATMDICFGNKLFALEPYENIPSKFILYYYLSNEFQDIFKDAMSGIIGGVSIAKFNELVIPLPPVEEQHRIVTKIDQLMSRCDELEKLRAERDQKRLNVNTAAIRRLLDAPDQAAFDEAWQFITRHFGDLYTVRENVAELRKAILQLAVMGKLVPQDPKMIASKSIIDSAKIKNQFIGQKVAPKAEQILSKEQKMPLPIPPNWKWVKLEDLITSIDAGWSPACESIPATQGEWGVLKTTSVQPLAFWPHENKALPKNLLPRPEIVTEEGDILITRAGPKNRVGICCVAKSVPSKLMLSDKIIRIKLDQNIIDPDYFALSLSIGTGADQLELSKSGMAESQMNISQEKIKKINIALPPINEQKLIIQGVNRLSNLCDICVQNINSLLKKQEEVLKDTIERLN